MSNSFEVKRTQEITFTKEEAEEVDKARLSIKILTGKEISTNTIIKKSTVSKIKNMK